METKDKIEQILRERFNVIKIVVEDESTKHTGHAEAKRSEGGHYKLLIVSPDFGGKSVLEKHKLVYKALSDEMQSSIHALAIEARSS